MGDKYDIFYKNISSGITSSIYNKWSEEDFSNLTSSARTIYYDSNIAFTSGDKSIVSGTNGDGSLLAVPDLYGTLKGLNDRINSVSINNTQGGGEISSADALLYVNTSNEEGVVEHIISPGGGSFVEANKSVANDRQTDCSISLQSTLSPGAKFTVNGDDFLFTVNDNTLSLTDLLKMIEELRARTALIKTSVARNVVTGAPYFSENHDDFGVNEIQQESN